MRQGVRYQGEVIEWNDDRGFGFVRPRGSGSDERPVFLPIRAFASRGRRPAVGDQVTFEVVRSEPRNGKRTRSEYQAEAVAFLGSEADVSEASLPMPKGVLGTAAIAYLLGLGVIAIGVPMGVWLLVVSVILSVGAVLIYGADKLMAGRGLRRVSEQNLLMVSVLGGWPGALLAQQMFRHKTQKQSFQIGFRVSIAVNILLTVLAYFVLVSVSRQ